MTIAGYSAVRTEGALLPPDLLARIATSDTELPGLRPESYGLAPSERVGDAIVRSWTRLSGVWQLFADKLDKAPASETTFETQTRQQWLVPLLQELGFGQPAVADPVVFDEKTYPVSHRAAGVAIHLLGARVDLDRRPTHGVRPAHGMMQEFLNRSDDHLWGVVTNGMRLRLLRDSSSLTRQAYCEFDLEAIFRGQQYAEFALCWLVCHATRFVGDPPPSCILERWSNQARTDGTRALDQLRGGVEAAITALGNGFLADPANDDLRRRLRDGDLAVGEFQHQLLRLVYRLLFLLVAEARGLMAAPGAEPEVIERYRRYYSVTRMTELARRQRGTAHGDLWAGLRVVFGALAGPGLPALGLYGMGSFLWSDKALADLGPAALPNKALLEAIGGLTTVTDQGRGMKSVRRAVDYRNLGAEELGSVYESLLELHPTFDGTSFALATAAGNERKTTGSYYTPTPLIRVLLDSALDPVLDEAEQAADPESAILNLKIIDPAAGSGHFLIAAAHRIAHRLASVRSGESEPAPDELRHALREVIGHCVYGIDVNPMAVELCKVSLWMEATEPGCPLGFLDHRIVCGNSLLGATPALLAAGVPGDAFKLLTGDDKAIVAQLKKQNAAERKAHKQGLLSYGPSLAADLRELARSLIELDATRDDTVASVATKEQEYLKIQASEVARRTKLAADAWCASFVALKDRPDPSTRLIARPAITDATVRQCMISPDSVPPAVLTTIKDLTDQYRFLHLHVAFPEVFGVPDDPADAENPLTGWSGGFDVVLGNPPWDTLSPDRREFFSNYHAGLRSMSPAAQKAVIDELLEDASIAGSWDGYCRALFAAVHFFKASGRYRLFAPGNLGKGDFNVYRMFVETALTITRPGGFASQVVPAGLYGGANASAIRKELFDAWELKLVLGLVNTQRGWFRDVDIDRFCAYAARSRGRTAQLLVHFGSSNPDELTETFERDRLALDADEIRERGPSTYTIPDIRDVDEIVTVRKIYAAWPAFGDTTAGPPHRHYQAEVHMGNDNGLFSDDPDGLPVYEGRMIDRYDYRAKIYVSGRGNSAVWDSVGFDDVRKAIAPQWRMRTKDIPKKLGDRPWHYRIGFGDVANPRNERSLVAALVPPGVVCGHTVPTIVFDGSDDWQLLVWIAIANSFSMDFITRKKLSSPHLSFTVLDSLPFPRLVRDDPRVDFLAWRTLRLTCTGPEMSKFWNEMVRFGWCEPITADAVPPAFLGHAARTAAMAEIDAFVAREIFNLTRVELSDILEAFPVKKRRDEKAFGEYQTKRLVLERFDAMVAAEAAGREYETILDPPPADPSRAHTESTGPRWAHPERE